MNEAMITAMVMSARRGRSILLSDARSPLIANIPLFQAHELELYSVLA
jgi:hypothetical protein